MGPIQVPGRPAGTRGGANAWHRLALEEIGRPGTQRVGAYTELPALIRQLGADPAAMIAGAGLAPDALATADGVMPYASLGRLLKDVAAATGCAHAGLLAGRMWHLSDLGLVGDVVRHSPTLRDALRTLTVYQHLNSGGGLAFLLERGSFVELGYAIYQPRIEGREAIFDAVLAGGFNFLRELAGPEFALSDVLFSRGRPADTHPYRSYFHVTPRFDADACALRFPSHWMAQPVPGADAVRYANARRRAEEAGRGEVRQQVTRALRILMLSGEISGEATARMLDMHRRTLNRRLQDRGTTFQAVLDSVRAEVAFQLLESTSASLDDIASTLGYASVSPFMRAFGRWTGTTPGRWRRESATEMSPEA